MTRFEKEAQDNSEMAYPVLTFANYFASLVLQVYDVRNRTTSKLEFLMRT